MKYSHFIKKSIKNNFVAFLRDIIFTSLYIALDLLLVFASKIFIDQLEGIKPKMFLDIFLSNILGGYQHLHDNLYLLAILIMVLAIFSSACRYIANRSNSTVFAALRFQDQTWLFSHLESTKYSALQTLSSGDALQTVNRDENVARRFVHQTIVPTIYSATFQMLFSFVILFFINWIIALVSIIILPVVFGYYLLGIPQVRKRFFALDESEARITEKIEENIKAVRLVKAYGNETFEKDTFDVSLSDYELKNRRALRFNAFFFSGGDAIVALQVLGTLVVSTILVINNYMTIGDLMVATTFTTSLIYPVKRLGHSFANYSRGKVSFQRIDNLINMPKEAEPTDNKPDLDGDIVFDNVSFSYTDSSTNSVSNISLVIKKGTTTAIMGKTGSGKTTLINLLSRLYEPTSGAIYINGHDISSVDLSHLRDHVGVVLQEPFLFSRSVKSNISIKDDKMAEDRLKVATKISSLEETISELPEGLNTFVGEKGVSLSGGQKQRISMARMLAMDTPILIFDDSLSAVDTLTDKKIRKELEDRKEGVTTIIITHRVATAKDADEIIIMEDGQIKEIGSDSELTSREGLYKRISAIQGKR